MAKSPLILAALAKSAVPALEIVKVTRLHGAESGLFDSAILSDQTGQHYVVRIPQTPTATLELDVESQVLKALSPAVRERLPFRVTNIVGETFDDKRRRTVVFEYLYGSPLNLSRLSGTHKLTASIGESIAAIHKLDQTIVETSGLPHFDLATTMRRRLNELDSIAMTGMVSKSLLERWQDALEDVALFRFQPAVVHGELNEDTVLEQDQQVSAVLNWGNLHIGDPAEDFAWIMGNAATDVVEGARMAYHQAIGATDSTLLQRAQLYFELDCGRWLMHVQKSGDSAELEDANHIVATLAQQLEDGTLPELEAAKFVVAPISESAFVAESTVEIIDLPEAQNTMPIQTIEETVVISEHKNRNDDLI